MQQGKMKMRSWKKLPWEVKDANMKTTKINM